MREPTSNTRMQNPDGIYASQAREGDYYSLRDYFAGLSMQAQIQRASVTIEAIHVVVKNAYDIADIMLRVRRETS